MLRLIRLFLFAVLAAAGGVFVLGTVFLQDQPAIGPMPPPEPEDVRVTRAFYAQVRAATSGAPGAPETVTLSADTLQSALRLGSRLARDYRAETAIMDETVRMTIALPVRWPGGARWLNLQVAIAPFDDRFALSHAQLGGRPVPPGLALDLARVGTNILLGAGAGDTLFDAASAMVIEGNEMIFALRLNHEGRSNVIDGVFASMRGGDLPAPARIDHYQAQLRAALAQMDAPSGGSVLPLVRQAITLAYAQSIEATAAYEFTAALLALANLCGAADFHLVVGPVAGARTEEQGSRHTRCNALTLGDRIDLRRHFVTAAAIKAVSYRGFAVSIGEFKELHDTISGGSGFDFTDIVANNSGIRLATLFLSHPRARWPELLDRMQVESDVLPTLEGIPERMPRDQFEAQFGNIDSAAYRTMLDLIEARIDGTALHRTALH